MSVMRGSFFGALRPLPPFAKGMGVVENCRLEGAHRGGDGRALCRRRVLVLVDEVVRVDGERLRVCRRGVRRRKSGVGWSCAIVRRGRWHNRLL